jgi:hypothetical protein
VCASRCAVRVASETRRPSVYLTLRAAPCSIRPTSALESEQGSRECVSKLDGEQQVVINDRSFTFDNVFEPIDSQERIFATEVHPLLQKCLNGFNGTILAYGQTGSGKTYTMGTEYRLTMSENERGVVPRAAAHLFATIHDRCERWKRLTNETPAWSVNVSLVELYQDTLLDLLSPGQKVDVRLLDSDTSVRVSMPGLSGVSVTSEVELLETLQRGLLHRVVESHNLNAVSSRSHAIFVVQVNLPRDPDEVMSSHASVSAPNANHPAVSETASETPLASETSLAGDSAVAMSTAFDAKQLVPADYMVMSKIQFVDLAGSERPKRTGAVGKRFKEGVNINRHLLNLGAVIAALSEKRARSAHIPYRSSKLTMILRDSLGGNSRTVMIACVSPAHTNFDETLSTLKYASRARFIKNRVTVNAGDVQLEIANLRRRVRELQMLVTQLQAARPALEFDGGDGIESQALRRENDHLRSENEALRAKLSRIEVEHGSLQKQSDQLRVERDQLRMGDAPVAETKVVLQEYVLQINSLREKLAQASARARRRRQRKLDAAVPAVHSVSAADELDVTVSRPRSQSSVDHTSTSFEGTAGKEKCGQGPSTLEQSESSQSTSEVRSGDREHQRRNSDPSVLASSLIKPLPGESPASVEAAAILLPPPLRMSDALESGRDEDNASLRTSTVSFSSVVATVSESVVTPGEDASRRLDAQSMGSGDGAVAEGGNALVAESSKENEIDAPLAEGAADDLLGDDSLTDDDDDDNDDADDTDEDGNSDGNDGEGEGDELVGSAGSQLATLDSSSERDPPMRTSEAKGTVLSRQRSGLGSKLQPAEKSRTSRMELEQLEHFIEAQEETLRTLRVQCDVMQTNYSTMKAGFERHVMQLEAENRRLREVADATARRSGNNKVDPEEEKRRAENERQLQQAREKLRRWEQAAQSAKEAQLRFEKEIKGMKEQRMQLLQRIKQEEREHESDRQKMARRLAQLETKNQKWESDYGRLSSEASALRVKLGLLSAPIGLRTSGGAAASSTRRGAAMDTDAARIAEKRNLLETIAPMLVDARLRKMELTKFERRRKRLEIRKQKVEAMQEERRKAREGMVNGPEGDESKREQEMLIQSELDELEGIDEEIEFVDGEIASLKSEERIRLQTRDASAQLGEIIRSCTALESRRLLEQIMDVLIDAQAAIRLQAARGQELDRKASTLQQALNDVVGAWQACPCVCDGVCYGV